MNHLTAKTVLSLNGGLSVLTGVLLTAAPGTVGGWLGVSIDRWLRLLGLALIAHALLIGWMISKLDGRQALRLNLVLICGYPPLMLVVVVAGWVSTGLGIALVLADGAVIALIAALHLKALGSQRPSGAKQPA